MGRSNGYRPKVAVKKEVMALRARLEECRDDQWQKAGMIMDQITMLLGHAYGPMNARIEPRACRYCHYYGHTRQWCKKRIAAEERQMEALLAEDQKMLAARVEMPEVPPYDPTKGGQALHFDELGIPYTLDPDCGPLVGGRGDAHHGKWTFDEDGGVTLRQLPDHSQLH